MKALIFDMDGVIIDSEKVYEQVDQQVRREWYQDGPDRAAPVPGLHG